MLATTSWESMFETLCDYVKVKVGNSDNRNHSKRIFDFLLKDSFIFYIQTPENGEWDGELFDANP